MDKKVLQEAQMEAKERLKKMGLLQEVEKEEISHEEFFAELAKKDQKIQELNDELIDLGEKLVKSQEALAAAEAKIQELEVAKPKEKPEKAK